MAGWVLLSAILLLVSGCVPSRGSSQPPPPSSASGANSASEKRTFLFRLIGFCAGVNTRIAAADKRDGVQPGHAADELQKLLGEAQTAGVPAQDRQKFDAFMAAVGEASRRLREQQSSKAPPDSTQGKAAAAAVAAADKAGTAYGMPHLKDCNKVAQGSAGTWRKEPSLPIAVQQVGYTVLNGSIWVIGGLTGEAKASAATFVYDPVGGSWVKGPELPTPLHHAMAVTYRGQILAIGGWIPDGDRIKATTSARVLRLDGEEWVDDMPPLHHARAAGAATVVGDRIVVAGGTNGDLVRPTEVFDGKVWKDAAAIPVAGDHLAAVSDGRAAYFVGGRALGADKNTAALQKFDPASGKWTELAEMPTPRGGLGAALADGRIYAVGGESVTSAFTTVEYYEIADDRWSTGTALPGGRHGLAVAVVDDELYAIAGAVMPMHHNSTATVESLHLSPAGVPAAVTTTPATDPATDLADCPKGDARHWACLKSAHRDGKTLVISYTTNFAMDPATSKNGDHLHIYTAEPDGKGGTKPAAKVMQHMVAKPGSWLIVYDKKVTVLDSRTTRGGQAKPIDTTASLLCVRVASGAHMLAEDRNGGLRTGNCVPID